MTKTMTKAERAELGSLIRKREKVMKAKAEERSAALLAEFDAQSAKIYHWDDDPVWEKAKAEADAAVEAAQRSIEKRCKALGIPKEFAPGLQVFWHGRGHNAVNERRAELRRAAKSRIEAIEREAIAKIESLSLDAQTQVLAAGLESAAAKDFLAAMPDLKTLMPDVTMHEVEALVATRRTERQLRYLQ